MMFGSSEKTAFWLNLIKKAFMGDVLSGEVKETGTDGETLWLSYNFTPIYGEENTTDVVLAGAHRHYRQENLLSASELHRTTPALHL